MKRVKRGPSPCRSMIEGGGGVRKKRQRESFGVNWNVFPAVLAHELRNPLAGVAAHVDLLREMMDPQDPRSEFLEAMEEDVRRMERVLSSLLEYSRRGKPRKRPVRAAAFLEGLAEGFRRRACARGVEVRLDLEPALGTVPMDPGLVERVLGNLVENAFRVLEGRGGTVRISARMRGDFLEVSCADDGPGIPEEEKQKIFEPFFTRSAKGLGLGLPLARKIVEEHGGTLEVDSAPGKGAVFTFTLPARSERGETLEILEAAGGAAVAR